jgi:hypothetical protein
MMRRFKFYRAPLDRRGKWERREVLSAGARTLDKVQTFAFADKILQLNGHPQRFFA